MFGPIEILAMLLPVLFLIILIFFLYKIIDRWVDKSITVKKEQNALLSEIIKLLEKK